MMERIKTEEEIISVLLEAVDGESDIDQEEEEHITFSDHDSNSEQEYDESDEQCSDDIDPSNYFTGKNKVTKWSKTEIHSKFSKTKAANLVKRFPTPKAWSQNLTSELTAFQKIFDETIVLEIVKCTNNFIQTKRSEVQYQRDRDAKDTNTAEILAVFGLLYLIGIKRGSRTNVLELWETDGTGMEITRACMGYKRFLFLLRSMRFDDKTTRPSRAKIDKLAAIRTVLDKFVTNCRNAYSPGEFLTIDEKLEPFRGRCSFIQNIPKKPAKYGIKMYAMCDSKSYYTCNMEIYCGQQPFGPYNCSNSPTDVVMRLIEPISNGNLTVDSWYTSYNLVKLLLERKLTCIGTMRKDKAEIPKEFLPDKIRPAGSSLFGFQKDMTLVSFVPERNKAVILLSSMHDRGIIDEETNKPEIIMDYNRTKGGVNTVDQKCSLYTVSRVTRRWPLAVFFSLMNIAGINAEVLYKRGNLTDSPEDRRVFLKQLALSLMTPHLVERSKIPFLPLDIRAFLSRYKLGETDVVPPSEKKRGRCASCGRAKNVNTTIKCEQCNKFTCKKHSISKTVCINCTEESG